MTSSTPIAYRNGDGQHTPIRASEVITAQERRFADEYQLDLDSEAAALRAGFKNGAYGRKLLGLRRISDYIRRSRAKRSTRTEIYADEVLRRWWLLATADARKLVEVHKICCRYCFGINHRYQRTFGEIERDLEAFEAKFAGVPGKTFDQKGGEGFDGRRPPNPDCPECFGKGEVSVHFHDSRYYSPEAQVLYDGVEVGPHGSIKVKHRDRSHAMDMVARHLGMLVERRVNLNVNPGQLSDAELITAITGTLGPNVDLEAALSFAKQIEHDESGTVTASTEE